MGTAIQIHSINTEPGAKARATAPATCGELVQGYLGDRDFLINSPIDLYSDVEVEIGNSSHSVSIETPGDYSKVGKAVRLALDQCAPEQSAFVRLRSQIVRGKGLASSTSEITAAIAATAAAASASLSPDQISEMAIQVEPSDGVYYSGVIVYDQIRGAVLANLGAPPPLKFIIVDSGGEVDTVKFDRAKFKANAIENNARIRQAARKVQMGFSQGEAALIAEGATLSALCNQSVLYKPELEVLIEGTREHGGLGVNCAHTGTVLGVMFDPFRTPEPLLLERVSDLVGKEKILGSHYLISGGARIV